MFKHYELNLIQPNFDDQLTDIVIDLEHLRKKELSGTTIPEVFFQLKYIFHMLESVGSLRIEGNNTTVVEYIEDKLEQPKEPKDTMKEIQNAEKAIEFIEKNIPSKPINKAFIREIHKILVKGLKREGSNNPGGFRNCEVAIKKSRHTPPTHIKVNDYIDELISFMEKDHSPKYHLIKIAIFHHRFAWIHPFDNGNGRAVRLLTYAMLIRYGFNVHDGRLINPNAIFYSDRDKYCKMLAKADKGTNKSIVKWCEYVLGGLKSEIESIDKLLDYTFLSDKILLPGIKYSLDRGSINPNEYKILKIIIEKQTIEAKDVAKIFPNKIPQAISRDLRLLKDKNMIRSIEGRSRTYIIQFSNNYLLRGVIQQLEKNNFIKDI